MKKKNKEIKMTIAIIIAIVLFVAYFVGVMPKSDGGEYDYCIEWWGLGGTLHKDKLLFTCFSLATNTFFCDYEIDRNTQVLMIKPIINITKNDDGFITQINYDQPNFFNCTRWLKSRS